MPRHFCAAGVLALLAGSAHARIDDPIPTPIPQGSITIGLLGIATGLTAPNYLTTAGDGTDRLFVVDQNGLVRLIKNGALQPESFLDVSSRLVPLGVFGTQDPFGDFDERGLLGLAFHPGFADSKSDGFGKFYTYTSEPLDGPADFTTADPPPMGQNFDHQSIITEWMVDPMNPDRADPASRRELIRIDQPQFNHNAGQISFGGDGLLYIALGDGGGADDEDGIPFIGGLSTFGHGPGGNGQNNNVVLGKILRIDPLGNNSANGNYGVPADNPFVGTDGVDEIYATGFRNPFRFSFDGPTGRLIVGDVGQNDIEEIDIVTKGGNYGWNLKEGTFKFLPGGPGTAGDVTDDLTGLPAGLTDPVAQYDHTEGLAIVGGFVYRGSAIPELFGKYVFGDFSTAFFAPLGRLFYADLDTGEIFEFDIGGSLRGDLGLFVKGFGVDDQGEIYLLAGPNLGPFGDFGAVYRLVPAPGAAGVLLLTAGVVALGRRRAAQGIGMTG